MRILWHSNAPWVPSAYGSQTRRTTTILQRLNVDISISAFFGLEHGPLLCDGLRVFGNQWLFADTFGTRSLAAAAKAVRPDVVVTLMDIWAVPRIDGIRIAPWFPIDHEDVPDGWVQGLVDRWDLLGVSAHSVTSAERAGFKARLIAHTVPCDVFRPMHGVRECSPLGAPSIFTFGMVAANTAIWRRKAFSEVFEAIAIVRQKSRIPFQLYIHAFATTPYHSVDLFRLATAHGVADLVTFPSEPNLMFAFSQDADMAQVYNWMDALVQPSCGEGFCVPIAEAQACGIPVITHDVTALSEVAVGGIKVPRGRRIVSPEFGVQYAPDPALIANAMLHLMDASARERGQIGAAGRAHIEGHYDTAIVEGVWREQIAMWEERLASER